MRGAWITAVAALGALLAPPGLAAADESAIVTIGRLEAEGYTVNIDRVGNAPLEQCTVTSVRNPQEVTRLVRVEDGYRGGHGGGYGGYATDEFVEIVVSQSISVSLDCTR